MTATHASMISQGEYGVLLSEHKALKSLALSAEMNEPWIEIHYIIHNSQQGSMDRLMDCTTEKTMTYGQNSQGSAYCHLSMSKTFLKS